MNKTAEPKRPPRYLIGRVGISAVNMETALNHIHDMVKKCRSAYICVTNVRTAVLSQKDEAFCRIQNESFLTVPDGMPLVWYAMIGGVKGVSRVTGPDLMNRILSISNEYGYSHYFYGSTEKVLAGMKSRLLSRFGSLDIRGMVSPPFRPLTEEEKVDAAKAINNARPTFVWVGLGAPKQEMWMKDMIDRIESSIQVGVGAAFGFAASGKKVPEFIGNMGLEWLFRQIQQPSRAPRFIRPFFCFLMMLFCQCFRRAMGKRSELTWK